MLLSCLVYHSIQLVYDSMQLVHHSIQLVYYSIELVYYSLQLVYSSLTKMPYGSVYLKTYYCMIQTWQVTGDKA